MNNNLLIQGENTSALSYLLNGRNLYGEIDLIYIDPPYATNADFTFDDERAATISRTNKGRLAYADKLIGPEYIEFLRERLVLLKELLSPKGSIYLHIDYKIGHYVKCLMDEVFGIDNFRNDITRIKCNPKNFSRIGYGNIKDMILFYTKGKDPIWNEPIEDYHPEDISNLFRKIDHDGRFYTTVPLHAPGETENGDTGEPFMGMMPPKGRHWRAKIETLMEWNDRGLIEWSKTGNPRKKIYADEREGKRVQDIWDFKDPQSVKYPTEKNLDMLKRIIQTSSNPGSVVLDCFVGSGTTLIAAESLQRNWIGIDQSPQAIKITFERLLSFVEQDSQRNLGFDFLGLAKENLDNFSREPYGFLFRPTVPKFNTMSTKGFTSSQ
ncbi:MAG: site-specific DNA-methyltransferase [Anaerolineaceae bacterium]